MVWQPPLSSKIIHPQGQGSFHPEYGESENDVQQLEGAGIARLYGMCDSLTSATRFQ